MAMVSGVQCWRLCKIPLLAVPKVTLKPVIASKLPHVDISLDLRRDPLHHLKQPRVTPVSQALEYLTKAFKLRGFDLCIRSPEGGMSSESEQTTNGAVQETESNPDFSRKHPLERRWTLWYDSKAKKSASSWTEALKPVCTVSTVEEFWWCAACLSEQPRWPKFTRVFYRCAASDAFPRDAITIIAAPRAA